MYSEAPWWALRCWPSCWWVQSSRWGLHPLWPSPCCTRGSACGPSICRTPAGRDEAVVRKIRHLLHLEITDDDYTIMSAEIQQTITVQPNVIGRNMLQSNYISGNQKSTLLYKRLWNIEWTAATSWFCPRKPDLWASVWGLIDPSALQQALSKAEVQLNWR